MVEQEKEWIKAGSLALIHFSSDGQANESISTTDVNNCTYTVL